MAVVTSRNSREFLERAGVVAYVPPRPRLAIQDLKLNDLPLEPTEPIQPVLMAAEGANPPDRGRSHPWPNQV